MRRVVLSILGTIAGLGALLSFKTHTGASHPLADAGVPLAPIATAPTSPGSAGASASSAPASKTVAGQAVQTRYGIVQVQVLLSGSSIQNVSFLQLTADDPRSQDINTQAAPMLVQQTMQAQSANIDGVSGATYTSQGYQQSLQSALDQAAAK
jgi:uncharacterized protein with FMN-binding domain